MMHMQPGGFMRPISPRASGWPAGRGEASVEVDVTDRRYVRPVKGGRPGQVTYKNERVVTVRPKSEA